MTDAPAAEATQPVRLFAVSGRIGRMRFIAYSVGVSIALGVGGGAVTGVLAAFFPGLAAVVALPGIAVMVLVVMLAIQRSHDFNTGGWLAVLALVPLLNLIFWFIPGTAGPNRYGAPTPPNGAGVIIAAIAVPFGLVFFVGLLAAVALPAYADFTQRARVAEVILHGASWRLVVADHHATAKALPSSAADLRGNALPEAESRYSSAVLAADGVIVLTLKPEMGANAGKTLTFVPRATSEGLQWDCTGGTLQPKYRPGTCRPH